VAAAPFPSPHLSPPIAGFSFAYRGVCLGWGANGRPVAVLGLHAEKRDLKGSGLGGGG
jgi:hypothetical protein